MMVSESHPHALPAKGFRKLLAAADAADPALRAVDVAAEMANRYRAELHVIFAEPPAAPSDPELALDVRAVETAARRRREEHARRIVDAAMAHQVQPELHCLGGRSVHALAAFASDHEVDLLVVDGGLHGTMAEAVYSELREALLGSRAGQIVDRAPCSVMIVK